MAKGGCQASQRRDPVPTSPIVHTPKGHLIITEYPTSEWLTFGKFGSKKEFFSIFSPPRCIHQLILRRPILKTHKIVSFKCCKDCPEASWDLQNYVPKWLLYPSHCQSGAHWASCNAGPPTLRCCVSRGKGQGGWPGPVPVPPLLPLARVWGHLQVTPVSR